MVAKRGQLGASWVRIAIRHRTPSGFLLIAGVLLFLGLVSTAPLGCGPGYPPDCSIEYPTVAFDAQGDILVAYQVNEGHNPVTYVQKLTPDGERLWGEQGVRLDDRQPEPFTGPHAKPSLTRLVADGDGSATIFWTYEDQIGAARLTSDGRELWRREGIVEDAFEALGRKRWEVVAGSACTVIAWIDAQEGLNLQSIDGGGNVLWSKRPRVAGVSELQALCDDEDNTWLLWVDAATQAVSLQAFDRNAEQLWAEAKELKEGRQPGAQEAGTGGYSLWLAEDDVDGVIAAWRVHLNGGQRGTLEVRSVSIDGATSVSAADRFFAGNERATLPGHMSDGKGGLFAFWNTGDSILAQLIDSQGRTMWGENGLMVTGEPGSKGDYLVNPDEAGGMIASWAIASGSARLAQRVGAEGNLLWQNGGVTISTAPDVRWWSLATKNGAAVFSGTLSLESLNTGSSVQRVDPDGTLPWGADGIRLDDWRENR